MVRLIGQIRQVCSLAEAGNESFSFEADVTGEAALSERRWDRVL